VFERGFENYEITKDCKLQKTKSRHFLFEGGLKNIKLQKTRAYICSEVEKGLKIMKLQKNTNNKKQQQAFALRLGEA
jgi:hypothetical protein